MLLLVALILLVVVPLAELYVIIQVSHVIGGWETIALLLVESLIGAWLMKRQGRGVLRRLNARLQANELPTRELVDGLLIILAGALMLTPGFLTDIVGFFLLIPPTRALVRAALMRRFKAGLGQGFSWVNLAGNRFGGGDGPPGPGGPTTNGRAGPVVDTTGHERRQRPELS